jgi:transcriptional regulator with XRE-family HTH domain
MQSSRPARGPGAVVRAARQARGLTLTELGARVGYSAAQISRYERDIVPLTNTAVLRKLAAALGIAPQLLGLTPTGHPQGGRHTGISPQQRDPRRHGHSVDPGYPGEDGEDQVRRRQLLAAIAATTAGAAVPRAAAAPAPSAAP